MQCQQLIGDAEAKRATVVDELQIVTVGGLNAPFASTSTLRNVYPANR